MASKKRSDGGGPQRTIASFFSAANTKHKSTNKPSLLIGNTDAPKSTLEVKKPASEIGHIDAGTAKSGARPEEGEAPSKRRRTGWRQNDSEGDYDVASPETNPEGKTVSSAPTPSPIDTAGSAKSHVTSVRGSGKKLAKRFPLAENTCLPVEAAAISSPETVIGKRLKLYWPLDKAWYTGCVKSYNPLLGKHVVLYDDGEEESVSLRREKLEWLEQFEKTGSGQASKWAAHDQRQPHKSKSAPKERKNRHQPCGDQPAPRNSAGEEGGAIAGRPLRARRQVRYAVAKNVDFSDSGSDDDVDWDRVSMEDISDVDAYCPDDEVEDEAVVDDLKAKQNPKRPASEFSCATRKRRLVKKSNDHIDMAGSVNGGFVQQELLASTTTTVSGLDGRGSNLKDAEIDSKTRVEPQASLAGEAADRFSGRDAQKFKFLGKDRRDAAHRRPADPDYNPCTLFLPPNFLKALSGGQRQWWEFKAKHMDKVLLFKMGKFYEMFEMDAHIAAKELDLQYMKGEQPHCGFPEKNFSDNAEKLARKGYRVLVVEQTETPDQLEKRRKQTGSKDKVVKREVCAVITKGTLIEGDMAGAVSEASHILSVTECALPDDASMVGLCVVDASTSCFQLGQFEDDAARTHLCSVLAELRPVELITPRGLLTSATLRALRDHTRQPLVNDLNPGSEFWDAEESLDQIKALYTHLKGANQKEGAREEHLPKVLRHMAQAGKRGELVLSAMGACVYYLRQALLDKTLLASGRIELLPGSDAFLVAATSEGGLGLTRSSIEDQAVNIAEDKLEPHMVLDAATLGNLEVLENRMGGTSGTLLAQLDYCVTPFGRRLLRGWLARPLLQMESIQQRQLALVDLKGVAEEAVMSFRKELTGVPDMERLLARLHASSGAQGRNAAKVVMYEDVGKKQVLQFTAALRGCRTMLQAAASFDACLLHLSSTYLKHLLTPGKRMPKMKSLLKHFEAAFDWVEAEKSGRIVPREGMDDDFDAAAALVIGVEGKLAAYLDKQRRHFGNLSEILYLTVGKEAYQIEVPDRLLSKVPSDFEVRSSRKGYRRYWTPEIRELLQEMAAGQERREGALQGILLRLVRHFCEDLSIWVSAVKAIAEVDVLISLATASLYADGPTCTPTFSEAENDAPWIRAMGLCHPTLGVTLASGTSFVPNDVTLGGTSMAPFMLLTGPNMGGKSTLLRQVCLAIILAQVGSDVPANHLELSPVDQVFVRMGARDHIMAGQSTFLVELLETASMLRSATKHSLVALDELGRGTATSDGQAIAHAVLQRLAHDVGCRGMFSTHYHRLATDHSKDPTVALCHMACKVGSTEGGSEEVTFLYKLSLGACPKSYGVNVARLAGMPETLLQRASARSAELELLFGCADISELSDDGNILGDTINVSGCELLKEMGQALEGLQSNDQDTMALERLVPLWERAKQFTSVSPLASAPEHAT